MILLTGLPAPLNDVSQGRHFLDDSAFKFSDPNPGTTVAIGEFTRYLMSVLHMVVFDHRFGLYTDESLITISKRK